MIFLIFGVVLAICIATAVVGERIAGEGRRKKDTDRKEEGEIWACVGIIFAVILSIAMLCVSIIIPMTQLSRAAELRAFYDENAQNYAIAVEKTSDVLTVSIEKFAEALIPIEGSIEKWEVGKEVAARIAEWRNAVNDYNGSINRMRAFDGNPLVGVFFPTIPDYLVPISIGE